MKLPRTLITLTAVFASSLLFIGIFLYSAIRARSVWHGIGAAAAAAASIGIATVIEDYCRAASFHPTEYFSMNRAIDEFFDPADPEEN